MTIQQYVDLYSGPAYLIHFKYGALLNQVYVSFMYGLFVPCLIPIALLGITNMYVVEKLTLAYYAQQPPLYDEKLHNRVLGILKYAPISMFLLGYWALGNRQMFFNETTPLETSNQRSDPGHELFYFAKTKHDLNHTTFALGAAILFLFMAFFSATFDRCLRKLKIIRPFTNVQYRARTIVDKAFQEHDPQGTGYVSKEVFEGDVSASHKGDFEKWRNELTRAEAY